MFFQSAFDPEMQLFYVAVVFTVVISVVLHELAHGWAALHQGDTTPRDLGHLTPDPFTHMGPFSIFALLFIGIAWGQMPVNPSRFRSRHGMAIVAAAGPAMNLSLAFIAATALAVLANMWEVPGANVSTIFLRDWAPDGLHLRENILFVLLIFASTNLVLVVFNLMPIPPLDGSSILASFHRGYAQFIDDPGKQMLFLFGFLLVFMVARRFYEVAFRLVDAYLTQWHHLLG